MRRTKYAMEFKDEAVRQVIDRGPTVVGVAKRLGVFILQRQSNL